MKTTTFCLCIEAGILEWQALLLCQSIRRFGGRYAQTPIVAVRPRFGPEISTEVRRRLAALDVRYVSGHFVGAYHWLPHLNKAAALAMLEREAKTEFITWLDSDMAFVREPEGLIPDAPFDYAARAGEGDMGSDGADVNAPYWDAVSKLAGLDFRAFPIVESWPEGRPMRGYLHGGVFTFRTDLGYGAKHLDYFKRIADARLSSQTCGVYHTDQVAQSLAAHAVAKTVRTYHWSLNYDFGLKPAPEEVVERVRDCKVLHYHDGLLPENAANARAMLARGLLPSDAAALIEEFTPLTVTRMAPAPRLMRKALNVVRRERLERHKRDCAIL